MTRRTYRVHRNCGTRLIGPRTQSYCHVCRKWLVGDSVKLVRKKVYPPVDGSHPEFDLSSSADPNPHKIDGVS